MKILIVGPISSPIVCRLWNNLKTQGVDVVIASHNAKGVEGVIDLGELRSFFDYFKFNKINSIVKKVNPDLVHAHILNHYGLMCVFQRRPLLVALWGSDVMIAPNRGQFLKKNFYKLINKFVLNRATRLHTSGLHVADEANNQLNGVSNKIDVFYWGFALQEPVQDLLTKAKVGLEQEFNLLGDGFIVFPRGLGYVYRPSIMAKIINALIKAQVDKKIIVFKGFASDSDELSFLEKIDEKKIIYVDRLLDEAELFYVYSRSDIHFSIPLSDSLGGGVVEPALLGSLPVLSNLPSYQNYLSDNPGIMLKDFSEESIAWIVKKIKTNNLSNSESNQPRTKYNTESVISKIIETYRVTIKEIKSE